MLEHAHNTVIQEAFARGSLKVRGQLGLHSAFKSSLNYKLRPCLKRSNYTNNQGLHNNVLQNENQKISRGSYPNFQQTGLQARQRTQSFHIIASGKIKQEGYYICNKLDIFNFIKQAPLVIKVMISINTIIMENSKFQYHKWTDYWTKKNKKRSIRVGPMLLNTWTQWILSEFSCLQKENFHSSQ